MNDSLGDKSIKIPPGENGRDGGDVGADALIERNVRNPVRADENLMNGSAYGKPIEILLVEDNPDDANLTVDALKDGRVRNRVSVVEDGVEAMSYLRRQGPYTAAPRPDLVLLDLNLPRMTGREVLAEIKADRDLKRIPVVIMTTSKSEQDVFEAYNLHANCYVTKPVDLDQFLGVVRKIEDFWLTVVTLPSR